MSNVITAAGIATEALGAIGAFPPSETSPQPEHLRRALTWLDMLLGELVGTEKVFSRIEPGTLSMDITNGTQSYDLFAILGDDLPTDSIQYIEDCWVEDQNANRTPIEIVDQQRFENVSLVAESGGVPIRITISRDEDAPTLRIFPVPASTDTNTYTLKFIAQRFAPNVAPAGVTGDQPQGSVLHAMGQAWQRFLVCQLAHDLGSGPIFKMPEPSLNRFAGMAASAKARLFAYENRAHDTSPPLCEAWGL